MSLDSGKTVFIHAAAGGMVQIWCSVLARSLWYYFQWKPNEFPALGADAEGDYTQKTFVQRVERTYRW